MKRMPLLTVIMPRLGAPSFPSAPHTGRSWDSCQISYLRLNPPPFLLPGNPACPEDHYPLPRPLAFQGGSGNLLLSFSNAPSMLQQR